MASDGSGVIEHGTSRGGRWLEVRRTRIALWIAVIEGILVAILHDVTRWTVLLIGIPLIAIYAIWGRRSGSDTFRQLSWIGGASQSLALIFVLLSFFIHFFVLALVAVAAVVALAFFFVERR